MRLLQETMELCDILNKTPDVPVKITTCSKERLLDNIEVVSANIIWSRVHVTVRSCFPK